MSKLTRKPERPKSIDNEVYDIAQKFLNNRIAKIDSLNFQMLSRAMLKVYQGLKVADPAGYQQYLEKNLRPSTFEIKGIALLSLDTARVFIREFWGDTLTTLTFVEFVKESEAWKYDGYDIELKYD
ncbi:MAG: hypothetical protein ACRECJ_09715 [Limisphaerales bacterium]